MKKLLLFLSLTGILVSCNTEDKNAFTISGSVDIADNGKKIFLEIQDEEAANGLKTIDTATIENGKFVFNGTTEEPSLGFLQIEDINNGKAMFILEKGEIQIQLYKDSINKSKSSGSFNNDELVKFNKGNESIQKRMMDFRDANQSKMVEAMQQNDTVTADRLREEYGAFQKELENYSKEYVSNNPKSYLSVLILENMLNNPETDAIELKKQFDKLSAENKKTKAGKKVEEALNKITALEIGNTAPDFSGPDPDGKIISLKESLGKVTIIDFWASWCKPCRIENPNVVALYEEFHDHGLNIIGVSLDREGDNEKWIQAIEVDNLTWPQVSNLKFWNDPIAVQYNIKSIPATFILDANGKIVAKNLRGDELKAKVKELLGV